MRKATSIGLLGASLFAVLVAGERDARACGGCFHPPTEDNSVITDHRMVLTISSQQTTLYDQIRYRGQPSDFAWVLPISGEVTVGLSADALFGALDLMSTTTVEAPDPNCPQRPSDCNQGLSASAPSASAEGDKSGGVTVTKQEVVGPYETVQLSATDPQALNNWLVSHSFAVPPDVQPIIAAYVDAHYGFLAMRLKPGANVQSMRPVRVTSKGASPVLPLRMVAAGTGATVGITLWVVGEGRYEAQNFPNFQITSDQIVWDWSKNISNYKDLRAQRSADGKSWETESSQTFVRTQIENTVKYGYFYGGGAVGGGAPAAASNDYQPVTDTTGAIVKTADDVRDEDLATLFAGVPDQVRVTRLRADLAHASLAEDLILRASGDQEMLPAFRKAKLESGQPLCTVYNGCDPAGQAPRDEAQARSGAGAESFSCITAQSSRSDMPLGLAVAAGFLGLAVVRSRRQRS